MKKISIIIPVFNEVGNIKILYNEITNSLKDIFEYEVIFVDDSSTDGSEQLLKKISNNSFVKVITNNKNMGQSYSLFNGIKEAKNNIIVTLDGDGQNDPRDISILLEVFLESDKISLVGGLRVRRKDSFIKIFSSKIANNFRSFILEDNCPDTGCGLKIFYRDIFLKLPFFNGIHRFLPALFNGYGYETRFIPVNHKNRNSGISKYGTFDRLFKGIIDIVRVKKIISKHKNYKWSILYIH